MTDFELATIKLQCLEITLDSLLLESHKLYNGKENVDKTFAAEFLVREAKILFDFVIKH